MLDLDYMNGSFFRLPEPMLFLYTLVDYIACFKRTFEKWKHQKHEFLHPWIVHCIQKRQMWYVVHILSWMLLLEEKAA
jgi:hypothetical protein